ncbi:MAG: NHL repeat-containing protein, partial [Elusimicrobiales bacterium]|nr:NHL repeat-containing protein [Elusimicrobiales bacterium]
MCKIMLLLFYFCLDIFSYDKIEVSSYLEEPSFSSVKYIYPKDDKVYILLANSLKVYSSTFSYIGTIGLKSENSTAFAISEDSLYVLDFKKCSIDVYDLLGNIVFSFGSCGKYYGQMSSPQDIRVFDNKIFVADEGGYINVYSKDGIFLYSFSTFSKDGTKRYFPARLSFDPEGFIYIVDKKNQVIAKYDLNGKCHFEYFTKEFPLDITESGFIYTGSLEGKIREYDLLFRQKGIFGTKGKNRYEFQSFSDIKAYKDGIFVADSKNKKLLYLKIYNRNVGVYERKIINKDYIWVKPYKTFKLNSAVFNVLDNETIYFFNNFKNNEGIYKYSNNNLSKIISYGKGNILGVSDIIEHNGKLYILDNVEKKVKVYEDEKYLFSFGDKVGFLGGSKEGKFSQPVKMVFDALEKIYILDTKLYMIQVFNKDGIFLYYIDLSSYKAFNFYDILLDEENNLYVLSDNKIFVFNSDGKYIREFDLKDVNSAVSFCYDGINYIFILDRNKSRVYVYDRKGKYISSFFCKGFQVTELKDPILIRFKNNKIYILDSSDRILSFDVFYHVYSSLFDVIYDSKSVSANFDFEIDNKEYLKNLVIEKSTDNKFLNVSTLSSIQSDKALIIDSTYYYRLRLISVTNQVSFSDIKSVFVFKDITKKGEQTEQI